MAFTADDFSASFHRRLGMTGKHAWTKYKLATGTAWCAAEISYTFDDIGAKKFWYGGNPVFYVPYAQQWMDKHWTLIYSGAKGKGSFSKIQKNDIIIFCWTKWSRDHIGAADGKPYKSSKYGWVIPTIEGNTSGGIVAERTREKKYIGWVYRPPWQEAKPAPKKPKVTKSYSGEFPSLPKRGWFQKGDKGVNVKRLQRFLNWAVNAGLKVDGEYGAKTEKAVIKFEKKVKIKQDGQFGKNCLVKAKVFEK